MNKKMDYFEFYKELYHKENERRQEVENSLNIPIAVVTAISSVTYYFVTSFDYSISGILNGIFIVLISITILSNLFAIYFLVRALGNFTKGYEYSGIPYVKELFDWNKKLEVYYEAIGEEKVKSDIHFKDFLIDEMVKHVDYNMYVNDRKHRFIFSSKKCLVGAMVSILLMLIPFYCNFFQKNERIQKVEVVKIGNSQKSEEVILLNNKIDSILNILAKKETYDRERQDISKADTDTTTASTTPKQGDKRNATATTTSKTKTVKQ